MSDSALQALSILRDGSQFKWYVIPLLAFVFYVYVVEAEKRNWNIILAGLAFWGMDWFNETVFHGVPGRWMERRLYVKRGRIAAPRRAGTDP